MPTSHSSNNSRSKSSNNSRSKSSSSKRRRTMKKSSKRELVGKKMPEAQIERIIKRQKSLERIGKNNNYQFNEEEYEKKRNALKKLRFDRDLNISKIASFKTAYDNATNSSKQHAGILIE